MEKSRLETEKDPNQLSLEQFAVKNKAEVPFQFAGKGLDFQDNQMRSLYLDAPDLSEKKSSKFFALSVGFHIIAVIGMSLLAIPMIEKKMTEVVEIEIDTPMIKAPPPPPIRGSLSGGEIAPARSTEVKSAPAKPAPVKAAPVKAAKARTAVAAAPAPKVAAQTTVDRTEAFVPNIPDAVPVAATIEDINAPDLDDTALKNSSVGEFDSHELVNDFENVDKVHQKTAADEAAKLNAIADQLASEQQNEIEGLKKAQDAENARIAALNKGRRSGELAQLAGNEGKGSDASTRNKKGLAAGSDNGSEQGQAGGIMGGVPQNVRKLEQLRQMPGNERPQYSDEERAQKLQGKAMFMAYITAAGIPTNFKLGKSTGYRNLDAKTLTALKKWRFYPGQEGWVELPFEWDMRGESQEKPTLLRRIRR